MARIILNLYNMVCSCLYGNLWCMIACNVLSLSKTFHNNMHFYHYKLLDHIIS